MTPKTCLKFNHPCKLKGFICGGPKKSPRTSSIVQIIFFCWSFEISEGILRNVKFIIGLDIFSNQHFIYLVWIYFLTNILYIWSVWIILFFVSTILLKVAKLKYFSLAPFCKI